MMNWFYFKIFIILFYNKLILLKQYYSCNDLIFTWYKYPSTVRPSEYSVALSYEPYCFFQKTACSSMENEWLLIRSSDPRLSFWPQWKCNCWNTYVLLMGPPNIVGKSGSKLRIITKTVCDTMIFIIFAKLIW